MTNSPNDDLEIRLQELIRDYSQLVASPYNPGEHIRILRGTKGELISELKALILQREAELINEVNTLLDQEEDLEETP